MDSRWYGTAGASLIAVAVSARYVAKWRRHRSLRRRGEGDRGAGGRLFIGLDLTDPTAAKKRPCDIAVLDADLACTFHLWNYAEDGRGIIPSRALGRGFILAIDGPQGLAGVPDAVMRVSEQIVNAPGRTPYTFPKKGTPYAGFITGSVKLFHRLVTSGSRFRLLGLNGIAAADANVIEVFPGGAWRIAAEAPLETITRRPQGAPCSRALACGSSPTSCRLDQLDAAMAAWVAYCFDLGESRAEGPAPELDEAAGVVREGYIVQPAPAPAAPPEGVESPVCRPRETGRRSVGCW